MAKKPEGPIVYTQKPATGEHEDGFHSQNPITEVSAHGDTPPAASGPNDNQGGK